MKNFFKNLFKKTYPERVDEDITKTRIVYAGPPKGINRRKRMQCVYAGPGMMGQFRNRRDTEMEDVYAGPPMPEDIEETDTFEPDNANTEPDTTAPDTTESKEQED